VVWQLATVSKRSFRQCKQQGENQWF